MDIFGAIDGFNLHGLISGWALRGGDGRYDSGLRIEARRGAAVLAQTTPAGPRLDVTQDPAIDAAFTLDCSTFATTDELLDGDVAIVAVDAAGRERVLEVFPPVREQVLHDHALDRLRRMEALPTDAVWHAATVAGGAIGPAGDPTKDPTKDPTGVPAASSGGRPERSHAARQPRIVFIGAGSTVFAKNLLGDILSEPALSASRICLYDIDPERLRVSATMAARIVQVLGVQARIEQTTDLSRALDGADYAINMIQVGGYRPCTVTDFAIPNRHGLRQTLGDTLGIGGIMRALRTIPVLTGMVREMERRCPDVLHLNYVNPMAMNCWALARGSRVRTVGLCHSVQGTAAELAQAAGVAPASVDYLAAGINHMAFFLRFRSGGEDLYPRLHALATSGTMPSHDQVRYDVLRRFGYFVTESSEHFAEYVPWYIRRDNPELIRRMRIPLDEYPRRCELQIADWAEQARRLQDPALPISVRPSNEYGGRIISAIETGQPAVIYGNVPNDGLIDNLPRDACVEVPCLADANGLSPVRVGALPPQLAALMQTSVNVQCLVVEAALTGRREHVYHAALLDPHTAAELDPDGITRLVDELLEAHRAWLPDSLFG